MEDSLVMISANAMPQRSHAKVLRLGSTPTPAHLRVNSISLPQLGQSGSSDGTCNVYGVSMDIFMR